MLKRLFTSGWKWVRACEVPFPATCVDYSCTYVHIYIYVYIYIYRYTYAIRGRTSEGPLSFQPPPVALSETGGWPQPPKATCGIAAPGCELQKQAGIQAHKCTDFIIISTTYVSTKHNDLSAAHVVVCFVSIEILKRRLLK